MVIAGGVQAAFAKLGIGHDYDYRPYDPYRDPEPRNRLRRVSSHLSVRQRKPSIVENACLSVHKIPAIVAVSGSPDAPTPRARLPSGASPSVATRNHRHSIAGWHQLVSEDHADTDVPVATRGDRSNTTPASINLPSSYDFCDLDRNTPHYSATIQDTASRIPNIQVTMDRQRPAEARYRHAPPTTTASYDFTDLDQSPPVALPVPRSSSPSPNPIHRSPSPAMGLSYGSISPTLGHMPYYHGPQRHDYSLRASHTPSHRSITPLPRTDLAPPTGQAAMSGSYDFTGMDQPSPTTTHENAEYGTYYCTSPMPIFTHGSRHGASRGNTYDPRRGDTYDATEGGAYALTRDTYDTTQGDIYVPTPREATRGQQTGLTAIIGEIEHYNRAHTSRPVPVPLPSPTATVSADGTLDSPYLDPEPDTAFRNRL